MRMFLRQLRKVILGFNYTCSHPIRQLHVNATNLPFPVIDGHIDISSSEFNTKKEIYSKYSDKYSQYLTNLDTGISEKAIARHVKKNKKLLVKDRLSQILDPGSDFLELSPLAGLGLEYGDVIRAGILCGIGWISGQLTVIQANDATVKGGTAFPITVKKQLRAQEIAEKNNLPCLYLIDSGGAFLPLQANIFPDEQHGGRVFYNEAVMSSKNIPQICVVCGSCTAGGAYIPTMADQAVIVHKIGTIYLGGPPLVQAATGEVVTSEDLGGATVHCSISGCTDYFAETEEEAYSVTRDIFSSLGCDYLQTRPKNVYDEPMYDADELGPLSIHDESQILPIDKIIARIVDGSRFHEFKRTFGPTLATGFAFIKGILVGIVANNGPFTSAAALKGAHFVQLCCQQETPIIFLQDIHPDIDNNESSLVKDLAKLIAAISCAKVPKITIVMGRSHGPSSYAMCSRSLEPSFLFLWPTAEIGLDTTDKLVKFLQNDDDQDKNRKVAERYKLQSSAFYSTARLHDDGVIPPNQTREILALSLRASLENRPSHSDVSAPMFRM